MTLAELEKERGYTPGAAARIREKRGLLPISPEDAIKNIHANMKSEEGIRNIPELAEANFNPQPKKGK